MAADPLATVIYLGSSAAAHTCTSMVVTFWLNCSRIENKFKSNSSCNHHLNHCVITACCHSQLIHRDIFEFNIFLIWVLVCWWWWYDWSFACLIAAVVTTTSVILSSNKIQNRDTLVRAYPGCPLINEHSYSFQRILQNNWKHTHAHTHINHTQQRQLGGTVWPTVRLTPDVTLNKTSTMNISKNIHLVGERFILKINQNTQPTIITLLKFRSLRPKC